MPQAFIQNVFSLVAVSLIVVRVVTLLAQLQMEDFQTHTSVETCFGWRNNSITQLDILLVCLIYMFVWSVLTRCAKFSVSRRQCFG